MIGITGNRHPTESDIRHIKITMKKYPDNEYVLGGATGVDTETLKIIGQMYPRSFKLIVVPFVMEEQPRDAREVMFSYASKVIELKLYNEEEPFRRRNEVLVTGKLNVTIYHDGIDKLLAFWNGQKRSGTFMTMNIAERAGVEVIPIKIEGGD